MQQRMRHACLGSHALPCIFCNPVTSFPLAILDVYLNQGSSPHLKILHVSPYVWLHNTFVEQLLLLLLLFSG